jgi:hypothetical protein
MNRAEEIVIDVINRASTRIHWVVLANSILCAIVLSNLYTNKFSYDGPFLATAGYHIVKAETDLSRLEQDNSGSLEILKPNGQIARVREADKWDNKDLIKYSKLLASQQRAVNELKSFSFGDATAPFISTKISSTDLDVMCGFVLIALSIWLYLSINHINNFIENPEVKKIIVNDRWAIGSMIFNYSAKYSVFQNLIIFLIIGLPFFAMIITTVTAISDANELASEKYYEVVAKAVLYNLRFLLGISVFLGLLTLCIMSAWGRVSRNLA